MPSFVAAALGLIDHAPLQVLHFAGGQPDIALGIHAQLHHVIAGDALLHQRVQLVAQTVIGLLAQLPVEVAVGKGRLLLRQAVKNTARQIGVFLALAVALFDFPVQVAQLGFLTPAFLR